MKSNLSKIMKSRGMKQKYLANKIEVSETTLSLLVRDKQLPTLPVAYKIAKALDMYIEEIWVEK